MHISTNFPPNYRRIQEVLGDSKTSVYTYGDTIYNPWGRKLTQDIIEHEKVHMRQQGAYPEFWCEQYLTDPAFRLQAEVEAYGTQYAFALKHVQNRALIKWLLDKLAAELASPCYSVGISCGAAHSKIRNYAKHNPL